MFRRNAIKYYQGHLPAELFEEFDHRIDPTTEFIPSKLPRYISYTIRLQGEFSDDDSQDQRD